MQTHIIENNVVTNTIVATVAEARAAFPDAVCVDAAGYGGGIGWAWDGEQLTAPGAPEPDWPTEIAERRWQHETGGIVLGGIPVATDDRSKTLINGAALRASREPDYTLRWKTAEGFVDLPADQVLSMADAVADHVQACFDREAELLAAVTDGSFAAEMLEQGWPA